jgi:hypothetical protein
MPELSVSQPHADRLRPHPQQHRLVAKGKPWIDRRLEFDDQVYQRLHPIALRERFHRPPVWTPELIDDRWRLGTDPPRAAAVLVRRRDPVRAALEERLRARFG